RELHVGRCKQIAMRARLADDRHPVAFEPEDLPVLCRSGDLQAQRLAGDRLHFDFATKDRRRQRYLHAPVEILAFALEARMRRDAHPEIQVARGCAATPGFAFAADADARAVADPRWNPDVDRSRISIQPHRQPPQGAVIHVLESELKLLLDIASCAGARRAAATARAPADVAAETAAATEERLEEVRERMPLAEHLAHFL